MGVEGKKVLVVGLARSGVAAARLLAARGAFVIANDMKSEAELLREAAELRALGVSLSLGGHPESLFVNADLIVLSPGVPTSIAPLERARQSGVEIISEVELAARHLRGRLIGITGSNGKTTTTSLTGELMRAMNRHTLVGGNIGLPLTSLVEDSTDDGWTVAELSSFQLETIETLRVNVAVVTNITPDHLDRHPSFDDYVRAKHRIFLNQRASDRAVVNGDDPAVASMIARHGLPSSRVTFSSRAGAAADIYVRDRRIFTRLLSADESETEVLPLSEIPLRGMHNAENAMAALAATICATGATEGDLPALREAVKRFKAVEHRLEFVAEIGGVSFYNDSKATNVDSTLKALESFDRDIILILGGRDKDGDYTLLAPLVRERVKQIILLGAASEKIAAQLDGVRPMSRARSMNDVVLKAMEVAGPGDTVLLAPACASFDMFDNFEHRGRAFKEAVYALANRVRSGWTGRLTT